jgi:hypothetical protein
VFLSALVVRAETLIDLRRNVPALVRVSAIIHTAETKILRRCFQQFDFNMFTDEQTEHFSGVLIHESAWKKFRPWAIKKYCFTLLVGFH